MGQGGFREGKIVISGGRMAHRNDLMRNGAQYDARGNFFYVPEEELQNFLRRFTLRDMGSLAQPMEKGETYAFGPSGQKYNFRYRVVPLDELIESQRTPLTRTPNTRVSYSRATATAALTGTRCIRLPGTWTNGF